MFRFCASVPQAAGAPLAPSAARRGRVDLGDVRYLHNGDDFLSVYALRDGDLLFTRYNVSGLTKSRCSPHLHHWCYESENWSVAEFMTHVLRLQPETFSEPWLSQLGVKIESPILETILCWPRFRFGGKTIQPDVAVGFQRDIILFEFKRPGADS